MHGPSLTNYVYLYIYLYVVWFCYFFLVDYALQAFLSLCVSSSCTCVG